MASGVTVAATVTVAGNTVTINPTATLLGLNQYRVVLSAGMTDQAGNPSSLHDQAGVVDGQETAEPFAGIADAEKGSRHAGLRARQS